MWSENEQSIVVASDGDHRPICRANEWLAIRIPEHWQVFVLPVPAGLQRFLVGRDFDGTDASGTLHSVVRVTEDNRINGIHYFLRRSGAEEDDIVLLRFDLAQNAVVVSIIDDDALEELNPET